MKKYRADYNYGTEQWDVVNVITGETIRTFNSEYEAREYVEYETF